MSAIPNHLISLVSLALLLSACVSEGSRPPVGLCKDYSRAFANQVADELETLPPNSAAGRVIADYMAARDAHCG